MSDLGDAQMRDPEAENYVSVTTDGDQRWEVGPANDWQRHPWNRGPDLRLVAGEVDAGMRIEVRLGGAPGTSPGYRAQSFAESAFRFWAAVDLNGKGSWVRSEVEACPAIEIWGNRTIQLRAIVPQATDSGPNQRVHLKCEDAYGNVAGEVPVMVDLLGEDGVLLATVAPQPGQGTVANVSLGRKDGWRRVTAATRDGTFWSPSNPVGPSPMPGYELFFGEIHGQSGLCDGTNSPAEVYEYARVAAGLDFAAVTSHDFELTADDWSEMQRATREAHRPGEFVTFLGYEWSGRHPQGGDNNIYFLGDEGPLTYSAPWGGHPAWDPAEGQVEGSQDLREVIEQLREERIMVVPHCGGRCCNLDFYDAEVMPLFEIHSCHRTYEHIAQEAIRRRIRFGFIGGSDDHRGALGDSHLGARERFFSGHSGLVAAYATELTREGLSEAFFSRRVYATNGPRIVLAAFADEVPMGGEFCAPKGTRVKLSFWTRLDGLLDRVELVRDGTLVRVFYGPGNQVEEFAGETEVEVAEAPHAYYWRVFQTDGGRAWSSPTWVERSGG
jgi:hypothetical protein